MKKLRQKNKLQAPKEWLFESIFLIDSNQLNSSSLVLLMTVLELTVVHYFYIHPNYPLLHSFSIFQYYFLNIYPFFFHLAPFNNPLYALLLLTLYPLLAALILSIKYVGPNRILIIAVQILVYAFPLFVIKVMLQFISGCIMGQYLFLIIPLGLLNLLIGGLLLAMTSRLQRYIELPFVLFLQLGLNQYAMMGLLGVRLALLLYLNYPRGPAALSVLFEVGCYLVLLLCNICNNQMINYISFASILIGFVLYGANLIYESHCESKNIYDYLEEIEEQQQAVFEIYRLVEAHHIECIYPSCACHSFWQLEKKDLHDWVYAFEEQRLRRQEQFYARIDYCNKCCEKYDFRLNGLMRICDYKTKSIVEQYQIFRVCRLYEISLRKQDKNYKYGEHYHNVYEEIQIFYQEMMEILTLIREFWTLITNFDGSTRFLSSILSISAAITLLRQQYDNFQNKYDNEFKEFKYAFEVFQTVILNEEAAEEDELIVPDSVPFLVTNDLRIVNTNNNFATLVNTTPNYLIGQNYLPFVPEVYREMHLTWTEEFMDHVGDYEGKKLVKCLSVGGMEIKQVQMEHRVLPRFLEGLEIFSVVRCPVPSRQQDEKNFVFLLDRDSLAIKNVEAVFFEVISFKKSQQNIKRIKEMTLHQIFDNFTLQIVDNPSRQVSLLPHFLMEYTVRKKHEQVQKKASVRSSMSKTIKSNKGMTFEFQILHNARKEDPFLKVLFRLKQGQKEIKKEKGKMAETSMAETVEQQQSEDIIEKEEAEGEVKKTEEQEGSYRIPLYMLGLFGIAHLLYSLAQGYFTSALSTLTNRYQFYIAFDYTTLDALGVAIGVDQTALLKTLWIDGYGDFAESFNAFTRITDPYFLSYFDSKIIVHDHNQLFAEIQSSLQGNLASINIYSTVFLIVMLLALGHYLLDFALSLRYIFRIEQRVGELLLQFVVIDPSDVKQIICVIEDFSVNILNSQAESAMPSLKLVAEDAENSALDLMRGPLTQTPPYSIHEAGSEQILETKPLKKPALKKAKYPKQQQNGNTPPVQRKQLQIQRISEIRSLQSRSEKHLNINLFREKYGNIGFILSANKKLFLMIFLSAVLSCTILTVALLTLYQPMREFSKQLSTLDSLYQSKVILLKSMQEIAIANYTLAPHQDISTVFLHNEQTVATLNGNTDIKTFQNEYTHFMGDNMCGRIRNYNCAALMNLTQVPNYGIKVMNQYIDQFFRRRNQSALMVDNTQNTLITYEQLLIDVLIADFQTACNNNLKTVDAMQLKLVVIGTVVLLVAMALNYFGLAEFKNRIVDSNSLLRIIPKDIAAKHESQIGQLMMDKP